MNKKTALIAFLALIVISVIGLSAYLLQGTSKRQKELTPVLPEVSKKILPPKEPTVPSQPEIDTSDWKVYRNEKYGFEFKYPKEYDNYEWCRIKEEGNEIRVGPVGMRFIIQIRDARGVSLSKYVDQVNKEEWESEDIGDIKNIRVGDNEGIEVTYSYGPRYSRTIFLLKNNKAYHISFHAGISCLDYAAKHEGLKDPDIVPSELDLFEQIPFTFRFY